MVCCCLKGLIKVPATFVQGKMIELTDEKDLEPMCDELVIGLMKKQQSKQV